MFQFQSQFFFVLWCFSDVHFVFVCLTLFLLCVTFARYYLIYYFFSHSFCVVPHDADPFTLLLLCCSSDVVPLTLSFFLHCFFLRYCSLHVIIPIALLLLVCCHSSCVATPPTLLFFAFHLHDAHVTLFLLHCSSCVAPPMLIMSRCSSRTVVVHCSFRTTSLFMLPLLSCYYSFQIAFLTLPLLSHWHSPHTTLLALLHISSTYQPSLHCFSHDAIVIPLALLLFLRYFFVLLSQLVLPLPLSCAGQSSQL